MRRIDGMTSWFQFQNFKIFNYFKDTVCFQRHVTQRDIVTGGWGFDFRNCDVTLPDMPLKNPYILYSITDYPRFQNLEAWSSQSRQAGFWAARPEHQMSSDKLTTQKNKKRCVLTKRVGIGFESKNLPWRHVLLFLDRGRLLNLFQCMFSII